MAAEKKWFEYAKFDAWGLPLSNVTILNADRNLVCFGIYPDKTSATSVDWIETVEISDAAMDKLLAVLRSERLYGIKELEGHNALILDGVKNRFYFSDGERICDCSCSNASAYYLHERMQKCPNAAFVLETLEKIKQILVPEGVPSDCFELD